MSLSVIDASHPLPQLPLNVLTTLIYPRIGNIYHERQREEQPDYIPWGPLGVEYLLLDGRDGDWGCYGCTDDLYCDTSQSMVPAKLTSLYIQNEWNTLRHNIDSTF